MTTRYRLGPDLSQFTVQAFASGVLSFLGHSPTFAVRDFKGTVAFVGDTINTMWMELTVQAESLELLDKVSASDRREIEGTMRRDALETSAYPEIRFESADVSGAELARGHHRAHIAGQLWLHGVTRPQTADAEALVFPDGVRLQGGCVLRLSDYRIRPVTALGGTIRLKDELKVSFDLAAFPEGS
jgi:polyisoprenoid-binding protein YceI